MTRTRWWMGAHGWLRLIRLRKGVGWPRMSLWWLGCVLSWRLVNLGLPEAINTTSPMDGGTLASLAVPDDRGSVFHRETLSRSIYHDLSMEIHRAKENMAVDCRLVRDVYERRKTVVDGHRDNLCEGMAAVVVRSCRGRHRQGGPPEFKPSLWGLGRWRHRFVAGVAHTTSPSARLASTASFITSPRHTRNVGIRRRTIMLRLSAR